MSLKNIVKLIAGATLALSAVTAQAGDDDRRGCSSRTLKGTYSFSNYAQLSGVFTSFPLSLPIAFAGQMYFPGDGTVIFQTTDNMGGGSGAAPHLTTVSGTVAQVANTDTSTTSCVYDVAVTLLVTGDNCPLQVHLNVFADDEGDEFHAITTSVTGIGFGGGVDGGFISAFEADRVSKRNTLRDGGSNLSTEGSCKTS